jgi:small subunit ribosomal protein S8
MTTDPISDMLIQLKNASRVGKLSITVPFSNIKLEIAKVLLESGYLKFVSKRGKKVKKFLYCELAYLPSGESKLTDIARVSKPSKRVYVGASALRPTRQGRGLAVLTTPKGVLSDRDARAAKVGGEVLFTIW